jgi:hypothetical protein
MRIMRGNVVEPKWDVKLGRTGNHALGNARLRAEIEAELGWRAKRFAPGRPRQSTS